MSWSCVCMNVCVCVYQCTVGCITWIAKGSRVETTTGGERGETNRRVSMHRDTKGGEIKKEKGKSSFWVYLIRNN